MPGSETRLYVSDSAEVLPLVEDFAKSAKPAAVRRAGGAEKALLAFGRAVASGTALGDLSPGSVGILTDLALSLRAAAQGIVIAGSRVGTVQLLDNIVEDTVQGIHVGVSEADTPGRESGESVMLARNVVRSLVPSNYGRDRHAIFVGNAKTIHVLDTVASLRRVGQLAPNTTRTPVVGIRIHGELGGFMVVRQSSLTSFAVGVKIVPTNAPVPEQRVWLVAETVATGATTGVEAPDVVERIRNAP